MMTGMRMKFLTLHKTAQSERESRRDQDFLVNVNVRGD